MRKAILCGLVVAVLSLGCTVPVEAAVKNPIRKAVKAVAVGVTKAPHAAVTVTKVGFLKAPEKTIGMLLYASGQAVDQGADFVLEVGGYVDKGSEFVANVGATLLGLNSPAPAPPTQPGSN